MCFVCCFVLFLLLLLLVVCLLIMLLFVVQVIIGEVVEYKQMKSNCMIVVIEEEGDLLIYSVMVICDNRSVEVEKFYFIGYDNCCYSVEVCGILLYQIGLIYMSCYNDQCDDVKVIDYFQCVVCEFFGIYVVEYVQVCLLVMCQWVRELVQKSVCELFVIWKLQQNFDFYKISFDLDMILLLCCVVFKDWVDEVVEFYLLVVNDLVIFVGIKEKVFYQFGLMYLVLDNLYLNCDKVIEYLCCQLFDYFEGELLNKVGWYFDQVFNV